ncbi:MAG: 2-hydroxychromene-2-carboxylate isomerase [Hyphomicrobiales bacterium]|nr:2-hydroxychromene-2-carboxylate isomerase [Hyphomicrobiales bacterium]
MEIDFYFGLGSRYSYLAFTQIEKLEAKHDCRFMLHPLSSIELMELRGVSPFEGAPVSGQYDWTFRRRDAEMWADHYAVPFVEPAGLPKDHRLMARACHAAGQQDALRGYSRSMFAAVFAEGKVVDEAECIQAASKQGIDAGRFELDLQSAAIDREVTATAIRAFERGAFGVPTLFVGDEMIWGNDRLVLVDHLLAK